MKPLGLVGVEAFADQVLQVVTELLAHRITAMPEILTLSTV